MRIIKLSDRDKDFPNRKSVDYYFQNKLLKKNPPGKFLLTKGRISKEGIETGEQLIFSYKTEILYMALSASGRKENLDEDVDMYPFYFVIDMESLTPAKGNLSDIESLCSDAGINKNIVRAQGWPCIQEPVTEIIWKTLEESIISNKELHRKWKS
jgi:hypothetical protein